MDRCARRDFDRRHASKFRALHRNSLLSRTGNCCEGTGNLHAANREFQPPSHDHRRTRFLIRQVLSTVPAANGGVRSLSSRTTDHRADARQGWPRPILRRHLRAIRCPSCHFAPVRMNDSLTFLFDDDASPDRGSARAAHSTGASATQFLISP